MKKTTLSKKFVAVFAFVLVGIFALLLAAVQIVANVTTRQYVNGKVITRQNAVNESINDLIVEAINGYTRMSASEHLVQFDPQSANAQTLFEEMVEECSLDSRYVNVALRMGNRWLSYKTDMDLPTDSFAAKAANSSALALCDTHFLQDGFLLVGRRFQLGEESGAIVFYLDCAAVNSLLAFTEPNLGYTFVTTPDRRVIARSDGVGVGETVDKNLFSLQPGAESLRIDGQRVTVATHSFNNSYGLDWSIVSVLYYNVLQHDLIVLSWVLAGVALAVLTFGIVFAVAVARHTAKPVNELSQYITEVDVDGSPRNYLIGNGDELQLLKDTYDQMILRLKDLIEQNNINMDVQRKLEIDQLQMQINPHFLYNTLDAIAWMAKLKKQPEIEKLVIDLARFFRLSLHKGDKFVTVAEEVELIYYFMEIQKARFPHSLALQCNVPPDLANCVTLKLILQPIVENSIKHGFLGKEGVGTITIDVHEQDGDILFDVRDDGIGFDVPEDLWQRGSEEGLGGYGLRNVNERVRLEYGEGYGLTVSSQKGVGTCVSVRIQKRNVQ